MPVPAGYEEVQAPKGPPPPGYEEIPAPKETPTGTPEVWATHNPEPAPTRKFQGPFLERATSQFGQDLQNPKNFLPSLKDVVHLGIDPGGYVLDKASDLYHSATHGDPAEAVGHLGVPILGALVTHAADMIPGPEIPPAPHVPAWKSAPTEGTPVPSILNRQPYAQAVKPRMPAPEVAPASPRTPAWKSAPTEGIPVPSILNRQPLAQAARTRAMPAPEVAPAAAVAPRYEYPPATPARAVRLDPEPGSPEDVAETKDIQGQIKDAAEAEDRNRLLAVQRDRFPQRTKFDLTNQPVKFTKTPGVSRPDGVKPGTVVPAPDQDLTGLLKKSLKAAKKAKD